MTCTFHLQLAFFLATMLLSSCTESGKATEKTASNQPNIIYILADDLGYGDVSAYNPEAKLQTLHIDRLAGEGMRFTDAHAPGSVCTPTRYGILTGRYCWRSRLPVGVLRGYGRALIEKDRETVASMLKKQGYTTGVVGKWHLGLDWVVKPEYEDSLGSKSVAVSELGIVQEMNSDWIDFDADPTDGPLDHGFDYSFILPASLDMDPYCYLENDRLVQKPDAYTPGNDLNTGYTGAFWRAGRMAPDFDFYDVLPAFMRKANAFIEQQAETESPFFLYLPLAAPHTPWVPTDAFNQTSQAGQYGDFVQMVDNAVGKVLETLEQSGQAENTLVIFTSDNGPYWPPRMIEAYGHRSAHFYRGMKADIWEGGHRIPFIARWPGRVEAGSESGHLTTLTNLMATCADILNIELEEGAGPDSHSIYRALTGEPVKESELAPVIHHSSRGFFAIRQGKWKLIEGRGSGGFSDPRVIEPGPGEPEGQLYDLEADPGETNNLYLDEPEIVARLKERLAEIKAAE